jgi:tRNA A-37 threonylcarbamoyl transferase component Bud32
MDLKLSQYFGEFTNTYKMAKPSKRHTELRPPKPIKQLQLLSGNLGFEKLNFMKTAVKTRCTILKPPSIKGSVTPSNPDMLNQIISKHVQKSRERPRLQTRPKTVSNLKKAGMNDTAEKNNDFNENLPRCITLHEKKESEWLGDFELGEEIGKGAYGVVRMGTKRITNLKVAIKSYEKSTLLHPGRKAGVEREIKILQKLDHPNIIKLLDTIETPSSINLIFEHISGCSLMEYLKSRSSRKLEESQARVIIKQVLEALEYCHSIGITHRDVKLENILLQDDHVVKIIDFGLSTYISSHKKVQLFCGTFSYMAPEILLGKEAFGPPVDVWAAVVMLFVMVTGTFPFKGNGYKEMSSKIMRKIYVLPPGLSSQLREVFRGVFEADLVNRPTAAQILASGWICFGMSGGNRLSCYMTI